MKSNKKILRGLQVFFVLIPLCSCSLKKDIKVVGFGYKGETITITKGKQTLLQINIDGSNEDKNKLCSFNKGVRFFFQNKDFNLNIIIDSSSIKLLDTTVLITQNSKEPYISLLYPSTETKYKRTLFVADETDSAFIKY